MPVRTSILSTAPSSRTGTVARRALIAAALSAGGALAGCKSASSPDSSSSGPTSPTTMNTPSGNMRTGMPQTLPVETSAVPGPTTAPHPPSVMGTESREPAVAIPSSTPPVPAVPAPTPTHVLTADEPYFTEPPTAGATPAGTLKAGSKVLLVIPGATYSQVTTTDGASVYTATDGLKPVGEK